MTAKPSAFLSYNRSDERLAAALEIALESLAKPLLKLRALDIFRDRTDLAGPLLWPALVPHLEGAQWLLLLASPASAGSTWCAKELKWWLEVRGANRIMILLTDGEIAWNPELHDFDWARTTAIGRSLQGRFSDEPLYIDLRWARDSADLTLRNARFREAVVDIAAPLHGKHKDELDSADLRQLARNRLLVRSGVAAITLAAAIAGWQALVASRERVTAENQRDRANQARMQAERSEQSATRERDRARAAQADAETQRIAAQHSEARAEQERDNATRAQAEAEVQRNEALRQRDAALARTLAIQSASVRERAADGLQPAALLALESLRIQPSDSGRDALRAALALLPRQIWSSSGGGPEQRVRAMAFSPNGMTLATGHENGTARLIDLKRGELAATLEHDAVSGAEVVALAFSADGQRIVTGSNDHTARLWDTHTGRQVMTLPHGGPVPSVALHPKQPLLATGSQDGLLRLWDLESERELQRIAFDAEVRKAAFSPDGHLLAAIGTNGCLVLYDLAAAAEVRRACDGQAGLGLAFSNDGHRLALARGDHAAVIAVATGELLMKATHLDGTQPDSDSHLRWIVDVALSPDGGSLASAAREGSTRIWNIAEGGREVLRVTPGDAAVAYSPDGTSIASASFDGSGRLWDARSGRELLRASHGAEAELIAFSPDGQRVASAGADGSVAVWSVRRHDQAITLRHVAAVVAVATSPDGKLVATADRDGRVQLWSAADGGRRASREAVYGTHRLAFSHDSRFVIAQGRTHVVTVLDATRQFAVAASLPSRGSYDWALGSHYLVAWNSESTRLRVWDSAGGEALASIPLPSAWQLGLDPSGSFLWTWEDESRGGGHIAVRALPGLEVIGQIALARRPQVALAPNGKRLAASAVEPTIDRYAPRHLVDLWDVRSARRLQRLLLPGLLVALVFDPSGKTLMTFTEAGVLNTWDAVSGALLAQWTADDEVRLSRFSPRGDALALGTGRVIHIIDPRNAKALGRIDLADHLNALAWSPDGLTLLTGSIDQTAALRSWQATDLQGQACERLTRNLTPEEWRRYLGTLPYRATCAFRPVPTTR